MAKKSESPDPKAAPDARYYRDAESGEDWYTHEALRERALGIAKRIFQWDAYDIPLAYSGKRPVTDPREESAERLPPVRVDEERYRKEPPRTAVKLGMWRLTAEVSVEHELEGRAPLAWRNRTEALRKGEPAVDAAHAERVAREVAGALPLHAVGPSTSLKGQDKDDKTFQVSWSHFVPREPDERGRRGAPVLVDGDALIVRVNAATGRPYTLFRKWRVVPAEREAAPASETAPAGSAAPALAEAPAASSGAGG